MIMPDPDPTELLGVAEEIFGFMHGFAMLLTRVSNGECDTCACDVCKDLRVIVETAEREMS